MDEETRIMNARLHRTEEFDASMELGSRYRVIDLDAYDASNYDEKRALRLVDTRTTPRVRIYAQPHCPR